jgi:riboflavin kinase/FMN adenylyltransferase
MQVISELNNRIIFGESSVATVGTFDGIHVGHIEIIRKMKAAAADLGLKTVVVTFSPHPRSVISDGYDIKLLTTLEEKKNILNGLGIDYLYVIKFSKEFSKKTYKEFFDEILIETIKVKHLVIGYDHKFGKGRDGDINKLVEYSKSKKIEITFVGPEEIDK